MAKISVTRIIHSRTAVFVMFIVAAMATWGAIEQNQAPAITGDTAIATSSPELWISNDMISFGVNMLLIGLIAIMSVILSKEYNPMKSLSSLFASFFLLFQAATPSVLAHFYGGTLTVVVMIAITILLLSNYKCPWNTQRVFLAFFLLMLSSLAQYSLLLYLPILLLGMWQMKIFDLRNVIAAILGLITPIWILVGFDLIDFTDFELPQFESIFMLYEGGDIVSLLFTAGLTIIGGILFLCLNFIRVLTYNSQIKAANALLTLEMIYTMILTCIDYNNIYNYLPFLNWLVAYQAGHFYATQSVRHSFRSFIGVLIVILVYLMIYAWNLGY